MSFVTVDFLHEHQRVHGKVSRVKDVKKLMRKPVILSLVFLWCVSSLYVRCSLKQMKTQRNLSSDSSSWHDLWRLIQTVSSSICQSRKRLLRLLSAIVGSSMRESGSQPQVWATFEDYYYRHYKTNGWINSEDMSRNSQENQRVVAVFVKAQFSTNIGLCVIMWLTNKPLIIIS